MHSLIFASSLLLSGPVEGEWIVEFVDVEREGDKEASADEDSKTSKSTDPEKEDPPAPGETQPGMPVINYYVRPLGKKPIPLDVSGVPQRELDSIRGFEWVRVTTEESDDPKNASLGEFVSHVEVLGFPAPKSADSSSKESSASPDKSSTEGSTEEPASSKDSSEPDSSEPVSSEPVSSEPVSSEPASSEEASASWPDHNPDDLPSSTEPWNETQSVLGAPTSTTGTTSSTSSAPKTRRIAMIEFQVQRASGLVSNAWGTSHIQNYFIDRTNLAFDQMAGHIVDIDFDTNGDGLEDVGDVFGPVVVQDNGTDSCANNWSGWMHQAKAAVVAQHGLGTDINGNPIQFCPYGPAHPLAIHNPPQCEFFDSVAGLMPPSIPCADGFTFGGIAQGGPLGLAEHERVSKNFAVRGDSGGLGAWLSPPRHHVFLHELGHNMGLSHSGVTEQFHPAPWFANTQYYYPYLVYGDLSCAMGDTFGLFNASQTNAMGLFPDALTSSATWGQFKLRFEAPTTLLGQSPSLSTAPGQLATFHALHKSVGYSGTSNDEFSLLEFIGADGFSYTLSFVTEVDPALPPPFEDVGDPDDLSSPFRNYNRWLVVHRKPLGPWASPLVIDKVRAPAPGSYLNAPVHYENDLLGVSFDTLYADPTTLVVTNLNIGCVRGTPTVTAFPEVGVFGAEFHYEWVTNGTTSYPVAESLHHPGTRQDLTLTNKDSILCPSDFFELRAAQTGMTFDTFIYPNNNTNFNHNPFWAAPTPALYPGDQYTYRAYNNAAHPWIVNSGNLGPYSWNLSYPIETRSLISAATEHILAPVMPGGWSNPDAWIAAYYDDISGPTTTMSSTSSSLLSDRRVRVTWDAENPDHYGSLPAFSPYAPPDVGCSSVPPSTPCIGKHPKDELHGYAIQRSRNGGPWTTVGHVSHVGYPQSMTWVDENIPDSGGTMRYWIALVDKVGNVSTHVTTTTSQYLKPIVEDSLDPAPGLPVP